MERARTLLLVSAVLIGSPLYAHDWPQWRGPDRDGVVKDGPPLGREWGPEGPTLVWEAPLPHGEWGDDGFGSPVVASGRVHQLVTWTVFGPTTTRTLTASRWQRMGLYDPAVPAQLREKVEVARLSPERAAVRRSALDEWLAGWLEKHLSEAERERFGEYAEQRLRQGATAASVELLAKLEPVVDKPFADTAALEAWLAAQGITGDEAGRVREAAPARKPVPTDTVVTFDAVTGRELWRADFPGGLQWFGTSGTPCVKEGRLYVTGTAAAYCLDAATGATVWRTPGPEFRSNSSPAVEDGVMVFAAGGIRGLAAATGKPLWVVSPDAQPDTGSCGYKSSCSAAVRRVDGTARAVFPHHRRLLSIEIKTGRVVWELRANYAMTTPALWRDVMVCQGGIYGCGYGLTAYRLTQGRPELLARSGPAARGRGASAVLLPGRALAVGREATVCMAVPSGEIVFESPELRGNLYSSPIAADGKLLMVGRNTLKLFDVSHDELCELASAEVGLMKLASLALADGLLYARAKGSIKCFDLRVPGATELEAIHAWKRERAKELCGTLDGDDRRAAVDAARRLARLGPVGEPIFARRVQSAAAAGDAKRLAVLLKGAVGACRTVRSQLAEPLRGALRGGDEAMVICAVEHWQSVGFPPSEAKELLLGVLRGPVTGAWKRAAEQLVAMDAGNVGEVLRTLCTVIGSDKPALRQEAALRVADVVAHGKDEAVRDRAAAASVSVLEAMLLSGHRTDEARAALLQLEPMPKEPGLGAEAPGLDF